MRAADWPAPLVLINAVGLTGRWLPHAPRIEKLVKQGWSRSLREVFPAVTCTAQASILTGKLPREHGIVANGWLYRDTREVRFWQQSRWLLEATPLYRTAREKAIALGREFTCANLFWWFNQGAEVDWRVTPKPHYGADGAKVFDILSEPVDLAAQLTDRLGPFPFHAFWGPMAGFPATRWIAQATAFVLQRHQPDLTLTYLPHLDYQPQRAGPGGCDMPKLVGELDDAVGEILEAATQVGARVWIVSEYGHCDVSAACFPNRRLRQGGLLSTRDGPFGEMLDTFASRALAVCDHQVCHVYVREPADVAKAAELLLADDGVDRLYSGAQRRELGLDHGRSGELIAVAKKDRWFAYPYWLDDRRAPDFAPTVDIHRKPGFDPCEMFFDPRLWWPTGRVLRRLVQKKLGFRTRMDVIPLDAGLVRGSHGRFADDPLDRPIFIGDGPEQDAGDHDLTCVHDWLLSALFPS